VSKKTIKGVFSPKAHKATGNFMVSHKNKLQRL